MVAATLRIYYLIMFTDNLEKSGIFKNIFNKPRMRLYMNNPR